ncbi:MAG: hypothetical protein Q8Q52_02995 [Acidimicrobiia bacterium]|nr:hypothetical protein [Acidimicrobiia bacterium]
MSWLRPPGELTLVRVEGTGSYGVGVARYLTGARPSIRGSRRPEAAAQPREAGVLLGVS